jgi:hypothetical protein
MIVEGGGHEFDNPGEQPTEAGITKAIAEFFVRTLLFHQPISNTTTVGSLPSGDTTSGTSRTTGTTGVTGNTGTDTDTGSATNTAHSPNG